MYAWLFQGVSVWGRLWEVSLSIPTGVTAVLGANGSGKTTLLKLAARLLKPDKGLVIGPRRVGAALQNPYLGFLGPTVAEDLARTAGGRGAALSLLREAGLEYAAERSPFTLSMGEARILSVLMAVSWQPEAVVIDEPTSGLDVSGRRWLARVIAGLDTPVLIAGHDLDFAAAVADWAVVLGEGRVRAEGYMDTILETISRRPDLGLEPGPAVKAALERGLDPRCTARCVYGVGR
ncbi:ATP-binding cassette domain-containing protein [Aeropyrum camini]|uniref:ABC-type cobalt transporter ATPase n=1 Tax=Aeropyrum camini SY1 = JCM 12091 TaxID=1198449 RepID=U3TG48_9CREN|nr:energy-coupling factor ABC transporter ATP-binding protein [Aeropyrum camini]BAN90973.1 ABC-type cobalt transporter ATPase [Aeropyrum camini SY1 = JCM 12091]